MTRLGVIAATTVGLALCATIPAIGAQPVAVEVAQTDPVAADKLEGASTAPATPPSPAATPNNPSALRPAANTPAPNSTAAAPTAPPEAPAQNIAPTRDDAPAPLPEFSKALPVPPVRVEGAPATTGAITPAATEAPVATDAPATNAEPATPSQAAPTETVPANAAPADAAPVQAAAPPDPVVAEIRNKLANASFVGRANSADVDALKALYGGDTPPVWTKSGAYTDAAKTLMTELGKAEDWGLRASDYPTVALVSGASTESQADAEAQLALSALRYARDARGGRIDPRSVSNIWDVSGDVKEPAAVLKDLMASSTPDAVLRDLHPKHPDFEALRQALLKARGPAEPPPPIDEARLVKLSDDKGASTLKVGQSHEDVPLLRKRLKVAAADGADESIYDEVLSEVVREFQAANGLKVTGTLNRTTRRALNREGEREKPADRNSTIDNLIVNMERWRWLPADMSNLYVWSNIPEFMGRVMKDGAPIFEERIIVGLPTWPTPMLTDSMEKVVFNPEWGMPDGIKVKELLPRLKRASGSDDFFGALFGGSSGGGRVLAAYGLKPSLNGRPVDPDSINWNNVDIRRYSFVQPPGAKNPLGRVKFMFPNRHDVYMHDTSERGLFAQSRRALSHGCIRVQNPEKLASVLLEQDKSWNEDQVSGRFRSGGEVLLDKPVPVYLTYFTARPKADGTIKTFNDIYGHDARVLSALAGRPVRYTPPDHSNEVVADDATVVTDPYAEPVSQPARKKGKQQARKKPGGGDEAGDIISNALSGLLFN